MSILDIIPKIEPFKKPITFPPTENVVIADDVMKSLKQHLEPSCPSCGIKYEIYSHRKYGELCGTCTENKKKEEKRQWMHNHRCDHTQEERLAILESFMYDHMRVSHSNPF
jgi:hypothetical protein